MNNNEISDYHKTRTSIDFNFINSCFESDERDRLKQLQIQYPNHIIRMKNSDLMIRRIGGSVPYEWNGLVYQD